jgi:tripartite ATP-independent transporter DctP family solute receptor
VQPPDHSFVQYHGQTAGSTLHKNLTAMWTAIRAETSGRVDAIVYAENGKVAGGDPAALRMLIDGEIQFYTLMGGIIGTTVPVAEAQQMPFAFGNAAQAHRAIDGPLGRLIGVEMAAKGMHLFPVAGFDNGMRQVAGARAIATPDDLAGLKIRVPPGQLIFDTFKALGAEPVTITANQLYDALQSGRVQAQENPLAVIEGFKLYEVLTHVSMTNHIWSGFNLMAHLPTWRRLPAAIKAVIERNVTIYVGRQRADQEGFNASLRQNLSREDPLPQHSPRRALVFNAVEQAPFRARLGGLYAAWRERLGEQCWTLLEAETGRLR